MTNTKIDLNKPMTREEFQGITNQMLDAEREYSELKHCEKEIKINDFVKPKYESTQHIEACKKDEVEQSEKLDRIILFVMRIICLVGYVAFLILFPIVTVANIGFNGYSYIVPLVMLVALSINHLICKDINTFSGMIYLFFIIFGIIVPIASLLFMSGESVGYKFALFAYMIAAFPQTIASFFVGDVTLNIVKKRPENFEKEALANKKDRDEEEKMRQKDEQRYCKALEERQKSLAKRDVTVERWKNYEELYGLWEGQADFAILMYDNVFKVKSVSYTIKKMNGMIDYFYGEKRLPSELIQSAVDRAREDNERIDQSMKLADDVAAEFTDFLTKRR